MSFDLVISLPPEIVIRNNNNHNRIICKTRMNELKINQKKSIVQGV